MLQRLAICWSFIFKPPSFGPNEVSILKIPEWTPSSFWTGWGEVVCFLRQVWVQIYVHPFNIYSLHKTSCLLNLLFSLLTFLKRLHEPSNRQNCEMTLNCKISWDGTFSDVHDKLKSFLSRWAEGWVTPLWNLSARQPEQAKRHQPPCIISSKLR